MSLVEKCWMVTSKISVIALLMITGIYFGKFVCPYIKKKKGAVAVSIVYITIMLVLYMIPPQIDNFSAYLIGVIAAFLAMYVEDRRNIYQKIFLAITFFSIRWLTVAMAARLDDLVTKALVFRNMSAEKVWLQYGLYVGTRVLDIVLCIAFIAVAIGLINKAYIYKKDEMSVKEMVMLIIPSLVGVTGYGILQYYLMIYERDTGKNLIDTYGFYGALSFLHYLISIVAILVVIVMFQNWKEMQEEQRGQELVLNQISDMKNIAMKAVFDLVGECKSCLCLSNLGLVRLPEEMAPYVARMDFIIGVQAKAPHNCGVVSWNGTMYINCIRSIREPELEMHFYRVLRQLGLHVKVESNQR